MEIENDDFKGRVSGVDCRCFPVEEKQKWRPTALSILSFRLSFFSDAV